MWDFGSGQEIKSKPGKGTDENDLSIIGLQYCDYNNVRCLICLGWNNKLRILEVKCFSVLVNKCGISTFRYELVKSGVFLACDICKTK